MLSDDATVDSLAFKLTAKLLAAKPSGVTAFVVFVPANASAVVASCTPPIALALAADVAILIDPAPFVTVIPLPPVNVPNCKSLLEL